MNIVLYCLQRKTRRSRIHDVKKRGGPVIYNEGDPNYNNILNLFNKTVVKDLQSVNDLSGDNTGYDKGLFSVVFHYKNHCAIEEILSCNVVNLDMGNHENVSQNDWSCRRIQVLGIDSNN